MGLLIISGTLRVNQFWPEARSDADTATVDLAAKNPFVFVNDAGKRAPTHAFDNAESVGEGRTPVIKTNQSGGRKVTIRLQGLDAPELHYQPQVKGSKGKNHPFRQSMGETCAAALHSFLSSFGPPAVIPCEVLTRVSKPSDVCDVFGRIVGNIVLIMGGARIDVNQWLVREGWALPGFYNSMIKPEILALLADHDGAKTGKRGLFSKKLVTSKLAAFDKTRIERKGPALFKPFSDKGAVNFPKFFRRQAERHVRSEIGEDVQADLKGFVAKKPTDLALGREDFLKLKPPTTGNTAKAKFSQLASFLGKNRFPIGPEIVFFEKDSKLVKTGTNIVITKF